MRSRLASNTPSMPDAASFRSVAWVMVRLLWNAVTCLPELARPAKTAPLKSLSYNGNDDRRNRAAGANPSATRAEGWRGEARAVMSLRSEEHTSELQSLMRISYAVFRLKKKNSKY